MQLLSRKGIGLPVTGFASSPADTDDLLNLVGGAPVVVKLLEGTQGKGVVASVLNQFDALAQADEKGVLKPVRAAAAGE